ncbi:rhodanese-like domain-containing protein [Acinetobacter tibetensis]|uniref:Rhodanese-like domain-containing protein n=1 Tax=Acinetobacter tibetensis TaxID=2943497 RepID=A0AAE9LNP1_9GAMM|nr:MULTISPECIES: rhodanese-like domain-containing protein [Acinetobacter]PWB13386.1 rhodanese [Acinetobacter sp. AM]USE81823.1 rhodanese-like domain-containing protein [Acinetobacter tibetensis]
MTVSQLEFYQAKLNYEMDSWDLFEALSQGQKIIVVDGRSAIAYQHEHIPNAINIPHRSITQETLAHLDQTVLYVTYCDGIGCNASTKTALKMSTLGFQVKELIGGLDWWKRDGYQTMGDNARAGTSIDCGCAG